jgi:hypothetical protein
VWLSAQQCTDQLSVCEREGERKEHVSRDIWKGRRVIVMVCLNALGLNFPAMAVLKGKDYSSESADGFPNGSLVTTTGPRWNSEDKFIIRVHHFQAYFHAYKAEGRRPFHVYDHGSHKNVHTLQFYKKKTALTKKVFRYIAHKVFSI